MTPEEIVKARTMEVAGVELYRQPGGCLEIRDPSQDDDGNDDLVHICDSDIEIFYDALRRFIDRTPNLHGFAKDDTCAL